MKILISLAPALALLATAACAPAKPTLDPASIQASAVAAANTMVALTQAAVPTETPQPPTPADTPTPLPSPTLLALPTLPLAIQTPGGAPSPIPAVGATSDTCNGPMAPKPAGPMTTVVVRNGTTGDVVLSLYLQKTNFGECGYVYYDLAPKQSVSASLPQGCYFGGAFVTTPKAKNKAFGNGCINSDRGNVIVGSPGADQITIEPH